MMKWVIGIGTTLLVAALAWGVPAALDSRWLPRSEVQAQVVAVASPVYLKSVTFDQYLDAQADRDIRRDIRAIDKQLTDINLRLQYESLSPERRAILEASKLSLEAEKADLQRSEDSN